MHLPTPDSYLVADRFLAGAYPGAWEAAEAERRLGAFARHGVTTFVDLTHPADTLEPYDSWLEPGARRISHPIVDFGTTTIPHMARILDDVDAELANSGMVYVHCRGGIGRTGTVVGCWLVRHGHDEGDAVRRIADLRRSVSSADIVSPETAAQRAMIESWKRGR